MLIKQMLTGGGDYEKSLRQRRWVAIGMLCIGLVGIVCYFLLVPGSDLSDYAQGFYLGAATGITAGALVLLIRTQYLISHPQAQRKAKIRTCIHNLKRPSGRAFSRLAALKNLEIHKGFL